MIFPAGKLDIFKNKQVIHWGSGGSTLYEIFSDITEYGFSSHYFHEALNILYSIGGPGVGG